MLPSKIVILSGLLLGCFAQVTRIRRHNVFLSRKKRYLQFPMNSNFVITLSLVKPLMVVQPRGLIMVGELDVPFPLPADTRKLKKFKKRVHYLQRREIFRDIEAALSQQGFNGTACLKRMICEAQYFVSVEKRSLVRDILGAVFASIEPEFGLKYGDVCHHESFTECTISLMSYILGSILPPT